jgi:hypothetical protein
MKMYLPPRGAKQSRRGFLQKGLFGGAILALGGGAFLATRPSLELPLPPEGLLVLSAREFALLQALAGRFIPVRSGFPSVEEMRVAYSCDRILAQVDETALHELKQLMMLFENALPNFVFGRRTKPFTALTGEDQDTVLGEWSRSSLTLRRTGLLALRGLVMAAYYGNAKTWVAVGYPGPPQGLYDPNAPVWKGEGSRPLGLGWAAEGER